MTQNGELVRIENRLNQQDARFDQVMAKLTEIAECQSEVAATCIPCREKLSAHELAINGNGIANGLKSRVTALEEAKPKAGMISIPDAIKLIGAIGTLIGAIAGGIGAVVATLIGRSSG